MPRVRRVVAVVVLALGALVFLGPRSAAAQSRPQSLHVVEIDSDDADEQAEALTGALRSRVRSASGWVLLDTTQSLSMLTAALRCPQRPDTACLQRIGDQLKTDRFIWGLLSRTGGHQVVADVHLWARGKPDQSIKETYSDNLKDQNDDTLRKIAGRFFDRLTGGPSATVVVHVTAAGAAGAPWSSDGTVLADDNQKVPLDHGAATLLLSGGPHTLEVRATGFVAARQSVVATAGGTQDLNVELSAVPLPPPPATPTSTRKTVGWATLVGGAAVFVAGGALGIVFEVERSSLSNDRANNYGTHSTNLIKDPCNTMLTPPPTQAVAGCSAHNTAQAVEIPALVGLGLGAVLAGTGIWLLTSEPHEGGPAPATAGLRDVKLLPEIGPRGGSLGLSASF